MHVLTTRDQTIDQQPNITPHAILDSWSWRELPKVVQLLRELNPDAVLIFFLGHLYEYRTMPTMIPRLAKIMCRRLVVLVQFSNLGQGLGLQSKVKRFLFKRLKRYRYGSLFGSSDAIVVMGEDHRQRALALAPAIAPKTYIVPPCPLIQMAEDRDLARMTGRRQLSLTENECLITFFGRLYPGKGIEALIEAVASLLPEFPNIQLGLIGGFLEPKNYYDGTIPYQDQLRACIQKYTMSGNVRFSGEYSWDGPEASQYLYASDIAVLPLEAGVHLLNSSLAALCAHGVPVVGTRGAVVDPVFEHKHNVFFIERSTPDIIAAALREVLTDEMLRNTLSRGSYRIAEEHFEWDKSVRRLSELMHIV